MSDDRQDKRIEGLRRRARDIDSRPGLLELTSRLRGRLPGDSQYGDTLSLAGRKPHQLVGQGLAVLQPKRASVLGELGLTALQLWQAASEAQGRGRGDRQLALLFTDLVGFSTWALEAGDAAAIDLLRAVADETEQGIRQRGGRVVKSLGDGWMAVFLDAPAAVDAALEIQSRLEAIEAPGYRPQLRAGVHCGRPRSVGDDYLGVDVNITARVAQAAGAGQVLVTDAVAATLDPERLRIGRSRRLKASGAPRELRVAVVSSGE